MRDVTNNNFGLLIAYVLPGLTVLWGASHFSDTLRSWLSSNPTELPTVGGFLYLTLGSVTAGMIVSTIRWLFIDGLHHLSGLKEPRWDFAQPASVPSTEVTYEADQNSPSDRSGLSASG